MRVSVPGGDNWIDLRGPGELTGADDDAWQAVYAEVWAQAAEAEVGDSGDGMEVSADGVSMTPKKRTVKVPADIVRRQRDALIGRLITAWSYEAEPLALPLPYTTLSRERLPLAACKALDEAIRPHVEAIKGAGPKEQLPPASTTDGSGSANGSAEESPSPLPDSPTAQPATA